MKMKKETREKSLPSEERPAESKQEDGGQRGRQGSKRIRRSNMVTQTQCLDHADRAHHLLSLLLACIRENVEMDEHALIGFYEVLAIADLELIEIKTILRT
jgi:hypothetical protein